MNMCALSMDMGGKIWTTERVITTHMALCAKAQNENTGRFHETDTPRKPGSRYRGA